MPDCKANGAPVNHYASTTQQGAQKRPMFNSTSINFQQRKIWHHGVTTTTHAIKRDYLIWMTTVRQPTKRRHSCVLTLKYVICVYWWTRQRIHNTLIVVDRYLRLMGDKQVKANPRLRSAPPWRSGPAWRYARPRTRYGVPDTINLPWHTYGVILKA